MNRAVRAISFLTAVSLLVIYILAGCGKNTGRSTMSLQGTTALGTSQGTNSNTSNRSSISNEVRLVMYLLGDSQPDARRVYEEVNKKLKKDINATVDVKYVPWADSEKKYQLIFASGEDFDLAYTADWVYYGEQATKKAFLELNFDTLRKYMPDYFARVSQDYWNQTKIDGKIYAIPYLNRQIVGHHVVMVRGDLREKYNIPEVKTLSDLDRYILTMAQNEKSLNYDSMMSDFQDRFVSMYYKMPNNLIILRPRLFAVRLDDMEGKVKYVLEDPAYLEMLKKFKKFADAGVWSKAILSSKINDREILKMGKSAFMLNQPEGMMMNYTGITALHPEWKVEVSDLWPEKIHESSSALRSAMAIRATSKNVERALMMLNLFGTNKEYYDLTTYGIADIHYQPVGDNKLRITEAGAKRYALKANCPWGWESKELARTPEGVPEYILNFEKDWIDRGLASANPIVSFIFNDIDLKSEMSAINSLYTTRGYALLAGQLPDIEGEVAKLKEDLKKAGIDKVQAELQKQISEYLQSLK